MAQREHDRTVIHSTGSGGSAGWFIAGGLIVAAIVAGVLLFGGEARNGDVDVNLEAPKVEAPAEGGGQPAPSQ